MKKVIKVINSEIERLHQQIEELSKTESEARQNYAANRSNNSLFDEWLSSVNKIGEVEKELNTLSKFSKLANEFMEKIADAPVKASTKRGRPKKTSK